MNELIYFFLGGMAFLGWFWGLGDLLLQRWKIGGRSIPLVVGFSAASTAVLLTVISLFVPLTQPISMGMGILFFVLWLSQKKEWPTEWGVSFSKSLPMIISLLLLGVYAFSYIQFADLSYDTVAYHQRFVDTFAQQGKISPILNPMNWVDHVTNIFPKSVEMMYGLAQQLIPESRNVLQYLIVLCTALLLGQVARSNGVKNEWSVIALYLGTPLIFGMTRAFFVEQGVFLFLLCGIILLIEKKSSLDTATLFGMGIVGFAMASAKINAGVIVIVLALIAWMSFKRKTEAIGLGMGAILGIGFAMLPAILAGINVLDTFSRVQALTYPFEVSILARMGYMLNGIGAYYSNLIGVGLIVSLILLKVDQKSAKINMILWGCTLAFFVAFTISSLYVYTYFSFAIYAMAFIGLFSISVVRFFEWVNEKWFKGKKWDEWASTILSLVGLILLIFFLMNNTNITTGGSVKYYPVVLENIPNTTNTRLFFMNNINPISEGLENVTLWDHTTFPRLEGDPCEFFRENNITHVIYWVQGIPSTQLDGGNPAFYEQTKKELKAETCNTVLFDDQQHRGPIIAKITFQTP